MPVENNEIPEELSPLFLAEREEIRTKYHIMPDKLNRLKKEGEEWKYHNELNEWEEVSLWKARLDDLDREDKKW